MLLPSLRCGIVLLEEKVVNSLKLNIAAACLFITEDRNWRKKVFIGGLVLLIPLVGWFILLGYRKVCIDNLLGSDKKLLPEWEGNYLKYLKEGFLCSCVIFIYLLPATSLYLGTLVSQNLVNILPIKLILSTLFFFPIFSPLALPFSVLYLMFIAPEGLNYFCGFGIIFLYFFLVFLIPLGFIQVSIHKKYTSAFNFIECLKFGYRNFFMYIEAWFESSIISLIGHFCLPFSPWGVTWAYLGIVYNFNEVLYHDLGRNFFWYNKLNSKNWSSSKSLEYMAFKKYPDSSNCLCCLYICGFYLPLPKSTEKIIEKYFL